MHPDMSWVGVLEHHASRTPNKPLAIQGDATVTYGEMSAHSAALAAGLQKHGVATGDVVALLSYNCIEFLETIFAANHLGAIAMPINWRLAAAEVALRSLRTAPAQAALARAREAAERARVPALLTEVAEARAALERPAARHVHAGHEQPLRLDEVEALFASGTLVIDACRRGLRAGATWRPLARRRDRGTTAVTTRVPALRRQTPCGTPGTAG